MSVRLLNRRDFLASGLIATGTGSPAAAGATLLGAAAAALRGSREDPA